MALRGRSIRDIAPFATLSRSERIAIAASSRFHDYRHGDEVLHAGDVRDEVVVVLHGFVRLFRPFPDGGEVTVAIVPLGHVMNIDILQGGVRHGTAAESIGVTRTMHIGTASLFALARRCPAFFDEIASGLLSRRDVTYMDTTATKDLLSSQILHALRQLTHVTRSEDESALHPLAHRLTHAEIARLVGAHRSSVTRALAVLDDQGLVRRERGHVTAVSTMTPTHKGRLRAGNDVSNGQDTAR